MNMIKKISNSIFVSVLLMMSVQICAQVTPNTPDKVLLEGKDLDAMYEVAKPATRMTFEIEGLEEPIDIRYVNSEMVLVVKNPSKAEKERIEKAFSQFSGSDNFMVKSQSEMKKLKSQKSKQ